MRKFFERLKGATEASRRAVTKTHAANSEAAEASIGIARCKAVAEPLARIAVLPASSLDQWPLWNIMKPYVPNEQEEWARYHYEVYISSIARDRHSRTIAN